MGRTLTLSEAEEYLGWPKKSLANNWRKYQAMGMLTVIKTKPWLEKCLLCVERQELDKFLEKLKRESK